MAKISIIIPIFNKAELVSSAIQSILNQSYNDVEILIVDDGSNDDTALIVEQYAQQHPQKIKFFKKTRKGVGSARNYGLKAASGEYICFLDADDILLEYSLEARFNLLSSFPKFKVVFSDYNFQTNSNLQQAILSQKGFKEFFSPCVESINGNNFFFNKNFFYYALRFSPLPLHAGTIMLHKSITDEIGLFREDVSSSEDTDYWIRILKDREIAYIDSPLFCYNNCYSDLSNQGEICYLNRIKIFKNYFFRSRDSIEKALLARKLMAAYHGLAYHYMKHRKITLAFLSLLKNIFYKIQIYLNPLYNNLK